MAFQDIHQLLRLRWPERGMHEGLAGLAQFFGLMLFAWMGLTGAALYFLGASESGALETIEEWHEVGETLIPLYLALHVGSVLVHTLTGHSNWRRIWTFRAGIR
jgi:Ni,Fe-hydrogenase I cytochrome b subunit